MWGVVIYKMLKKKIGGGAGGGGRGGGRGVRGGYNVGCGNLLDV